MLFRNDKDKPDSDTEDPGGALRVPLLPLRDIIVSSLGVVLCVVHEVQVGTRSQEGVDAMRIWVRK